MFQDGSEGPPIYSPQRCNPCQCDTRYTRLLSYPSQMKLGERGSGRNPNFTRGHSSSTTVRGVKSQRNAAIANADDNAESLRITNAATTPALA